MPLGIHLWLAREVPLRVRQIALLLSNLRQLSSHHLFVSGYALKLGVSWFMDSQRASFIFVWIRMKRHQTLRVGHLRCRLCTTRKCHISKRISNRFLVINGWKIHFQPIFQRFNAVGKVLVGNFFPTAQINMVGNYQPYFQPKNLVGLATEIIQLDFQPLLWPIKNGWKYFQPNLQY